MYEYRTASFFVAGKTHGHAIEEVDKGIHTIQGEGWEYVQLTQSALPTGIWIIVIFRRPEQS